MFCCCFVVVVCLWVLWWIQRAPIQRLDGLQMDWPSMDDGLTKKKKKTSVIHNSLKFSVFFPEKCFNKTFNLFLRLNWPNISQREYIYIYNKIIYKSILYMYINFHNLLIYIFYDIVNSLFILNIDCILI